MQVSEFNKLEMQELRQIVRQRGPKVCVCPVNGTRRWFTLEHANTEYEDIEAGYLDAVAKAYVDLFKLFFGLGIETLLVPTFGPDLLERGEDYTRLAMEGFSRLTHHPLFLNFYESANLEVRFYGDYVRYLSNTPFEYLIEQFDELTMRTAGEGKQNLYWGMFGHDATERVAQISVAHFKEHGRAPTREEIVTSYYGKPLPPVDIFIGFDKFSAFDMPLLATGNEDLYFTVSPTLYVREEHLRAILYDHLFTRKSEEDYNQLSEEAWAEMRKFYTDNEAFILGVGTKRNGIWYPLLANDDSPPIYS